MSHLHIQNTSSSQHIVTNLLPYSRGGSNRCGSNQQEYIHSNIEKVPKVNDNLGDSGFSSSPLASNTTTGRDYHPPPPSSCDILSPSLNYPLFKKALAFSVHALETEDFFKKHA